MVNGITHTGLAGPSIRWVVLPVVSYSTIVLKRGVVLQRESTDSSSRSERIVCSSLTFPRYYCDYQQSIVRLYAFVVVSPDDHVISQMQTCSIFTLDGTS